MPMFLFVILFGLSMDYHVFIISRIRENVDHGMSTDEAVEHGIKSTAGVVTSAAVVMVLVFSVFITLSFDLLKEFGSSPTDGLAERFAAALAGMAAPEAAATSRHAAGTDRPRFRRAA